MRLFLRSWCLCGKGATRSTRCTDSTRIWTWRRQPRRLDRVTNVSILNHPMSPLATVALAGHWTLHLVFFCVVAHALTSRISRTCNRTPRIVHVVCQYIASPSLPQCGRLSRRLGGRATTTFRLPAPHWVPTTGRDIRPTGVPHPAIAPDHQTYTFSCSPTAQWAAERVRMSAVTIV